MSINYDELEFSHLVTFENERTNFAAARETGSGRIRLFLIDETTGKISARNGKADSWEELFGSDRYAIIARVTAAKNYNQIPIFKVSGSAQTFIN